MEKFRAIYAQRNVVKIVKTEADAELDGNKVIVKLTQADTFHLNCNLKTDVQLRVRTYGGDSFVSDIYTISTERCLGCEVL